MPLRLAPEPPNIQPRDGFSTSDIFEAKAAGERLANVVADIEGDSVLLLDGPWGTGKSIFVRQWAGLLRNRGHPVVYFDAFAHDHLDDAFFPLMGQLLRAPKAAGETFDKRRKALIAAATPLVRPILTVLADAAVRKLTLGTMTGGDMSKMLEQFRATKTSRAQIMVEECIGHVEDHAKCVEYFRQELKGFVAARIDGNNSGSEDRKLPMVFIIDELDRCRPTYALSVLEKMKHVFAVDGVCFVIVTHLKGLEDMVRRAYGICKPAVYLEKFYTRRFDFEKLLLQGSENLRQRYLDYLANEAAIDWGPQHVAATTINNLTRIHNVSLRGQERIMVNYALFVSAMSENSGPHAFGPEGQLILASGLAAMRYISRDLFIRVYSQDISYANVSQFLEISDWTEITEFGREQIESCWINVRWRTRWLAPPPSSPASGTRQDMCNNRPVGQLTPSRQWTNG